MKNEELRMKDYYAAQQYAANSSFLILNFNNLYNYGRYSTIRFPD